MGDLFLLTGRANHASMADSQSPDQKQSPCLPDYGVGLWANHSLPKKIKITETANDDDETLNLKHCLSQRTTCSNISSLTLQDRQEGGFLTKTWFAILNFSQVTFRPFMISFRGGVGWSQCDSICERHWTWPKFQQGSECLLKGVVFSLVISWLTFAVWSYALFAGFLVKVVSSFSLSNVSFFFVLSRCISTRNLMSLKKKVGQMPLGNCVEGYFKCPLLRLDNEYANYPGWLMYKL